ncbi:uncharacterized protein METZ01_LOCUS137484 [marine metagenome]|uniref:Uncharacterized protein n=1 Tax=marine metagenome TaxID=408172 RepID=A0A381Z5W8_9ZZZZ
MNKPKYYQAVLRRPDEYRLGKQL